MTAPQRIHALPLHLANQIAAGEVIERPASVVKELIENSLDAGATEVTIHIDGAGSKLIRIKDNGHGIHPEDLPLALSRHATSKLSSTEQLSHIASLGFRGEALPSIASIAQLTVSSKQNNNEQAWQYNATHETVSPAAHPDGTTIEVRDLFFNVPARRHFLKGDKTELHHIVTTIHRLALSQFETGFHGHLTKANDLKLPSAKTAEQRQQRIAKICGKAFLDNSLYIQQIYNDIELHGWIATPQGHRSQTDVHYFFINGRVIRDRLINHAIRQAYSDYIPEGRYPAFVLYLTIPLDRVDINVHPTKHEVRFREGRLIHGLINKAITDGLEQAATSPSETPTINTPKQTSLIPQGHDDVITKPFTIAEAKAKAKANYNKSALAKAPPNILFGSALALLSQRCLLTSNNEHHYLLDLQTAENLLRQQQFQHAFESNTIRSRPILVPIKLPLSTKEIQQLQQQQNGLECFGFKYTLKERQLQIKAIPSLFAQCDLNSLFKAIAINTKVPNDPNTLCQILIPLLPRINIQNLDQARDILPQLAGLSPSPQWCYELDASNLQSLFKSN